MVLEEPRVPYLDPKAARRRVSFHIGQSQITGASKPTTTVTNFLHQGNTYLYGQSLWIKHIQTNIPSAHALHLNLCNPPSLCVVVSVLSSKI